MNIANFEKESELWQKSNPVRIKTREDWLDEEITKIYHRQGYSANLLEEYATNQCPSKNAEAKKQSSANPAGRR